MFGMIHNQQPLTMTNPMGIDGNNTELDLLREDPKLIGSSN